MDTPDRRLIRTVLVGLLLVLGGAGLQAHAPFPAPRSRDLQGPTLASSSMPLWPLTSTLAALLALATWWAVRRARRRRHRQPDVEVQPPAVRVHPGFVALLVLVMSTAPWLFLTLFRHMSLAGASRQGPSHARRSVPSGLVEQSPVPHAQYAVPVWLTVAGAVAVLLIVGVARLQMSRTSEDHPPTDTPELAEREETAVTSAQRALRHGPSPRQRIIGAFAAMEAALAAQDLGHVSSETPDELLSRIAQRHPGLQDDASRLTETFQYARFSSGPVTPRHVDVATHALTVLSRATARLSGQEDTW